MTEIQKQQIQALVDNTANFEVVYKDTNNPFAKAVYESFLNKNKTQEQAQFTVLLDIIRSHFVILKRDVILKNPIKWAVEAYVNVYNILFPGEFKLFRYVATYFLSSDLDEGNDNLIYNETICIGGDGLYYLCDRQLSPLDRGYESEKELINVHGSLGIC